MTLADIWVHFAAAVISDSGVGSTDTAAELADDMVEEFLKRFRPTEFGSQKPFRARADYMGEHLRGE